MTPVRVSSAEGETTMTDSTHTQTITQSAAQSFRRRRREGSLWTAPTGEMVRVRDLDISDHVILDQFPDHLRQMVYRTVERSAALKGDVPPDDDLFAGLSGEELIRTQAEIADTLCRLAWIDPQIVDEVTDPDHEVTFDDVPVSVRRAFMAHVFGTQAQEAQALSRFPGRSAGNVGALPAVQDVRPTAQPGDAPDPTVVRADGV